MTAEREAQAAAQRGEVERRVVTVLFADLVGFTTLAERLDAEDVALIQDAYFAAVRDAVARHAGRLEKFIGDAAMAVFGVPRGRDDDAERAVRTGLSLVEAVERLGARLDLDGGGLRLRVGVNTGEVVYAVDGPDAGRVTGDAVNTAARLQTAAEPGGVLVGEATQLAVAEAIELTAVAPLPLKGKASPVRSWRVVGMRAHRSRELAMGALRAPTIGRQADLARLQAGLRDALTGRRTERVLVVAPPGVGKTRLLDEFAAAAEPGTRLWRVRLRPEPGAAYEPLRGLFDTARDGADTTPSALPGRLAAAGLAPGRADVVAAALLVLGGVDGPAAGTLSVRLDDRAALFDAWLDGLDALAGERPQAWLVEDVHWASLDLIAFLEAATRRAAPAGRLLVATA
ncbi:MAG TPA: adenylate/guanylate cyclase domain-containing protein, partial [Candidatus Sulfotelmatobacter sp.]|nr:adenylate/guanylate cyclase domain-containing protein [Candidatus Sulfotelmatobacter sp.]